MTMKDWVMTTVETQSKGPGWRRRIRSCTPNTLNLAVLEALHEFYLVQCWVGRTAAGDPMIF